jgi:hypothetical protein
MNRQERVQQLEKLRVIKNDGRFVLEKFRIGNQINPRSSASVFWRQVLCSVAAGAFFLCSFSPAFADPFPLDLPKERLVPHNITPHLPPIDPFDQQTAKDLNDHSGEPVEEKAPFHHSDEKKSTTSQGRVEEHSARIDDPYQSKSSANHHSEPTKREDSSTVENSTLTGKRKDSSTSIQQQPMRRTENGAKLPQTATPAGSLLLQGLAIVLLGCALWKKPDVN